MDGSKRPQLVFSGPTMEITDIGYFFLTDFLAASRIYFLYHIKPY